MLARERVGGQEMLESRFARAFALQKAGTASEAAFYLLLCPIYAVPGGSRARTEQDEDVSEVLVYLYEYLFGGRLIGAQAVHLVSQSLAAGVVSGTLPKSQHNA